MVDTQNALVDKSLRGVFLSNSGGCRDYNRVVIEFRTTYVISAYHN